MKINKSILAVQLDSNKACIACKTVQVEPTLPTLVPGSLHQMLNSSKVGETLCSDEYKAYF